MSSFAVLSPLYGKVASSVVAAADLNLDGDAFGHFLYVGDYAYFTSLGAETFQCVHGQSEGFGIEGAEAFVDEKGFYAHFIGRKGG